MKSCFFFDMDGTLYNRKFHEVDENTFKALHKLQEQGDMVALATSRCLLELSHLPSCMRNFSFDIQILDGGSLILDSNQKIIEKHCMNSDVVSKFDSYCKKNKLTYRYSTENGNYWGYPCDLHWHQLWNDLYLTTPVYKEYEMDEVTNLMVRFENKEQEQEIVSIAKNCGIVRYRDCFEIRANGMDKSIAIQKIIDQYKIEKVYCFGDGHNDIDMLKLADVGVAMGNACQELKDVANIVIGDINDEPIYKFLLENNLCKEV